MKISLLLIAFLAAASTTKARLGESVEQCQIRYGKPLSNMLDESRSGISMYSKNDLSVIIHFLNGKADLIRYSPGQVSTVDLDLAQYLLKVNGRDKEWDQLTDTKIVLNEILDENAQYPRVQLVDPILWRSKDGILTASFSNGKGTFEVRASTFQDKIRNGL